MGNHKIALDIYELGTRKVPSSDSNIMVYAHSCLRLNGSSANQVFQLLRGQHEKLARQLTPPKAIDPLQMLPLELAEMTIRYLEFRHIVSALLLSSLRSLLILVVAYSESLKHGYNYSSQCLAYGAIWIFRPPKGLSIWGLSGNISSGATEPLHESPLTDLDPTQRRFLATSQPVAEG